MSHDNLANLLDSLTGVSVFVIEDKTQRLLYYNQRCKDAGCGRIELGMRCQEIWPAGFVSSLLKCAEEGSSNHMVRYAPWLKCSLNITADRILWDGRIPAVAVTVSLREPNRRSPRRIVILDECMPRAL
ncbi:hypothetical protein [Clostridium sp. AM58-1XD]|uniref:hypothetical protein n=1 Tax=Clostridium sp. AM58-1XD TaxID=2292307 RepID=UPI001FA837FA|nr:hypothetical protein [Clostridium sp. AM58-1XD]